MFGDDWSNSSGDMNYLICHLTQQNHVIEGSSNFVKESFPWNVTALPNLVAIGIVVAEITFFFSLWVFFHEHSQFTEQKGKKEAISLITC